VFGIEVFEPETMWLNITNIALGVMTLLCVGVVAWGVFSELAERMRAKSLVAATDDHTFAIQGLGFTMADGGKKVDEEPHK
jgi:hypothetical protein